MARFGYLRAALFSFVCLLAFAFTANAQSPAATPQVVMPGSGQPLRVAGKSSLYCAGYIRYQRLPDMPEIVGAEEEQEQRTYADGDIVYPSEPVPYAVLWALPRSAGSFQPPYGRVVTMHTGNA